eukprot:Hpha_TRINITY_DN33569_c0_g1::TRINITY_DN33569_c0_g1_i1::g.171084::m.171084
MSDMDHGSVATTPAQERMRFDSILTKGHSTPPPAPAPEEEVLMQGSPPMDASTSGCQISLQVPDLPSPPGEDGKGFAQSFKTDSPSREMSRASSASTSKSGRSSNRGRRAGPRRSGAEEVDMQIGPRSSMSINCSGTEAAESALQPGQPLQHPYGDILRESEKSEKTERTVERERSEMSAMTAMTEVTKEGSSCVVSAPSPAGAVNPLEPLVAEPPGNHFNVRQKKLAGRIHGMLFGLPAWAPDYGPRRTWDLGVLAAVLWSFIRTTYDLTQHSLHGVSSINLFSDIVLGVFFAVDIGITCNTAVQRRSREFKLITDRKEIVKHYATSGMLFADIFATVPFNLFLWWITGSARVYQYVTGLRLLHLFKLKRLLLLTERGTMDASYVRFYFWMVPMVKLLFNSLAAMHVLTLIRIMVSPTSPVGSCSSSGMDACKGYSEEYFYAFFWVWVLLTGQGIADLENLGVYIYATIVIGMGMIVQGHVVATMSALILKSNVEEQNKDSMRSTLALLVHYNIPPVLQQEVLSFQYHALQQNAAAGSLGYTLAQLPDGMKNEVGLFIKVELVDKVPMFQGLNSMCQLEIAEALEESFAEPDQEIITNGSEGREMFFLMHGFADVVIMIQGVETTVATFKRGDFFGEVALLKPGTPRTATIRALTYCDIFTLRFSEFLPIMDSHNDLTERIHDEASKRGMVDVTPLKTEKTFKTTKSSVTVAGGSGGLRTNDVGSARFSPSTTLSGTMKSLGPTPGATKLTRPHPVLEESPSVTSLSLRRWFGQEALSPSARNFAGEESIRREITRDVDELSSSRASNVALGCKADPIISNRTVYGSGPFLKKHQSGFGCSRGRSAYHRAAKASVVDTVIPPTDHWKEDIQALQEMFPQRLLTYIPSREVSQYEASIASDQEPTPTEEATGAGMKRPSGPPDAGRLLGVQNATAGNHSKRLSGGPAATLTNDAQIGLLRDEIREMSQQITGMFALTLRKINSVEEKLGRVSRTSAAPRMSVAEEVNQRPRRTSLFRQNSPVGPSTPTRAGMRTGGLGLGFGAGVPGGGAGLNRGLSGMRPFASFYGR